MRAAGGVGAQERQVVVFASEVECGRQRQDIVGICRQSGLKAGQADFLVSAVDRHWTPQAAALRLNGV